MSALTFECGVIASPSTQKEYVSSQEVLPDPNPSPVE